MPPSPSPRRSPSRESFHKRVNSFGNALPAKPKDDELTLFTDMQNIERENFLLEPSEDFDESICKAHKYPTPPLYNSVVSFYFCDPTPLLKLRCYCYLLILIFNFLIPVYQQN